MIKTYNTIAECVWHELGHFTVDILKIKNPEYCISSFKFQYTSVGLHPGWRCSVSCTNSNINSEKDLVKVGAKREISISILSLYAGSVFESVYRHINYNHPDKPHKILSFGSAISDSMVVRDIINELNLNEFQKLKWNSTRDKILDKFLDIILNNQTFISDLEPNAIKLIHRIESKYKISSDYLLELSHEEIDKLISNIKFILSKSIVLEQIEELVTEISNIIF